MVNMGVSCPTYFTLEAIIITFGDRRTPSPRSEIYPQNLSAQNLVVRGSKK